MLQPRRAVGQARVEPLPGPGGGGAVAAGSSGGNRLLGVPGGGVAEGELSFIRRSRGQEHHRPPEPHRVGTAHRAICCSFCPPITFLVAPQRGARPPELA